jgi:hypothetical protein
VYFEAASALLLIERCTFWDNESWEGGGIYVKGHGTAVINACTFSNNSSNGGAGVYVWETVASMTNSIIAFSEGSPVNCDHLTTFTFSCTNMYGNAYPGGSGTDWIVCMEGWLGVDGNFSADPKFCDATTGNLFLRSDSPCLSRPVCGLIGALGQGCSGATSVGAPRVERSSWGQLKAVTR